jgi:type II secretory pathway component PulC
MRPAIVRTTGLLAAVGLLVFASGLAVPGELYAQQAEKSAKPAAETKKEPARKATNLRDPFRSLLQRPEGAPGGQALPPGPRGLVITQLTVDGIVIMPNEKIAVVNMRGRNRAYFLRERDEVYNGYVARITEDAVIFRERATDAFGQTFEREVTKPITGSGAKQ